MSAHIVQAADAAAWYAAEHHHAAHDADALADARPAATGTPRWWRRRRAVARLRRRARLAGHLAAQTRADHEQLLEVLAQQVGATGLTEVPRTDSGAELLDRLGDALHAHHLAMAEAARRNDEAASTRWWQPVRRELAQLQADYATDCMSAQWERIRQVRVEVDHHVRARLPR